MSEGVNYSVNNMTFSHWIPLYFGHNKKKLLYLAEKAISMICKNTTKCFEPEMVIEVFTKIMVTLAAEIVNKKTHPSIRIIRLFTHFHAMFLLFLEQYPTLYDIIEDKL